MIGSLCSGYGGLDLAVEAVTGQSTAWLCEFDKHAITILSQRFPGIPNYGDITGTDWAAVESVDWLTAGYPCQPFSHAGQRKGTTDDRHIWPHIADAIRILRPGNVLLENVAGHLSLGFGDVLGDLAALGYDTRWVCVRASDVGAPHRRERVFIVAGDTASHTREPRGSTGGPRAGAARGQSRVVATDTRSGSLSGIASTGDGLPVPTERGRVLATDTRGQRHGRGQDGRGMGPVDGEDAGQTWQRERSRAVTGDRGGAAWGGYEPAIRRWERILGRPAPQPTEPGRNGPRLAPPFVEWMMGLPAGWVTDTGIPRNAQLKALGNGVVPQQAAHALRLLLADWTAVAA